jgi:prepilin-type processing-associated H-X9-DG protein
MRTKRKVNRIILLMFCYFVGLNSFAAGASTGLIQVLGPCLDDQTFAVAHLDVTRLDLDAFVDKVASVWSEHAGPDTANDIHAGLKDFRAEAGAELTGLKEAGGRDIFAVFSMYDFPYFFVAVPVPSGSDPARLHQQVLKLTEDFDVGDVEAHVVGRLILVGLERTVTRIRTASPMRSRVLQESLEACADKTVQILLFPSSDQRRVLAEMLPQVPAESGEIQLTTLGEDLQWAALGFDGPPAISLSVTIQSASADGAARILTLVKGLYALAEQYNKARPFIPQLDKLLERLTPRRDGQRLLLHVDSAVADSVISEFVAPFLREARTKARRHACRTNLRGIGKALLIYANDYDDTFPPDLETLIHKAEMPPRGLICPANGLRESYIYRGASITTSDTPWMITVYEKLSNHGDGRNVLFLDSHVEWVSEERFQELIKRDNEYRREKGLPVLPAQ